MFLVVSTGEHTDASDATLLIRTPDDATAFAEFYRRHVPGVLRFFRSHVRNPELATDLMSETFAAALIAVRRYEAGRTTAEAWLYAIARNKLVDSWRRGKVEAGARERLGIERLELDDADLERVEDLAESAELGAAALAALADLEDAQREAIAARVLDNRSYSEIASTLECSEAVVRKRVSRGLAALRVKMKEVP
jgi:RNA polymerase sigma-70 factor (ECF subfamily)